MTGASLPGAVRWPASAIAFALSGTILLALLAVPTAARAEAKRRSVGIFLPASIDDRDAQFKLGEELAASLGKALDGPFTPRSFGRYEDFAAAAADGSLDLALSEAFILADLKSKLAPIAVALAGGEGLQPWVILAPRATAPGRMAGQRLAVVKGGGSEAAFLGNAVLGGELPANHFKLLPVPTVESALKAVAAKTADAALAPASAAAGDLAVVYRSARIEGPLLVAIKGAPADYKAGLAGLPPFGHFTKFAPASGDELASVKRRIEHAPARRSPFTADSPLYRLDPTALDLFKATPPELPPFGDFFDPSKEQPDD
jgi:ABC-type amino acid transport substrate-binding protein